MVQRSAYNVQLFRSRMPRESQIQRLRVRVAECESSGSRPHANALGNRPFRRKNDRDLWKQVLPVLQEKIERFASPRDDDVESPACILLPQIFAQYPRLVVTGKVLRFQVFGIVIDAFRS